ncbi:MAG: lipopolysaccharide biosynthesis protein [Candidatus Eremiobacteraeota bacterium]|nr:lipopolysaccharide biosynthesis protein [Candidatus Eremiobacteraeota bacterium]
MTPERPSYVPPEQDAAIHRESRNGEALRSFGGFVAAVKRQRLLVAACTLIAAGIAVAVILQRPRTYTTNTTFMPQASGGSLAGLSTLAAQFGVNVAKDDPTHSPDFYAEVLRSREVLTALAQHPYAVQTEAGTIRGPLAAVLRLKASSGDQAVEDAIKVLRRTIFVNITRQTGIVNVAVQTPYPDLSQQIAANLLVELDEFNTRIRQTRASAEEKFLQEREDEARAAREVAEERLVQFTQANRAYTAPALAYQYSRLTREAAYRSEVVSTLTQGHAQARIEAARNTPVITVLDRPNRALNPDGRGLTVSLLLALILGFIVGIVLALVRDASARNDASEHALGAAKSYA